MFAIKLVQWTLDRLNIISDSDTTNFIIKSFEEYYENCERHSFDFTKNIYFNDFNTELESDFIVDENAVSVRKYWTSI